MEKRKSDLFLYGKNHLRIPKDFFGMANGVSLTRPCSKNGIKKIGVKGLYMIKGLILIIIVLLMEGCGLSRRPKAPFKDLEFSYTNTFDDSYSIKINSSDTVFITRYFPWPVQTCRGLLTSTERRKIDSFINEINFSRLDTDYFEPFQDGSCYQFYLKTDSLSKRIFVHSYHNSPVALDQFAIWLIKTKISLSLYPVDTIIHFKNNSSFEPEITPIIKNTIHYTEPKVGND